MSNPESAWRFLEGLDREERANSRPNIGRGTPSGPIAVEVTFAPFTPPTQEGDRG